MWSARASKKRLTDSIENVLHLTGGLLMVDVIGEEPMMLSEGFACPDCGISIDEIEPRSFSFNNPVWRVPGVFRSGIQDGVCTEDSDAAGPGVSVSTMGVVAVMGWQSSSDPKSYTMPFWRRWPGSTDFLWTHPTRISLRRCAICSFTAAIG